MNEDWTERPFNWKSGRKMSWFHWSRRPLLAMLVSFEIASQMYRCRVGTLLASCTAMLATNLPAWLTSPPPLEKKKLAPRRLCFLYLWATVRAIVDFPVPAEPFSQKIQRLSCPLAQLYISCSRSTRVSGRQVGSCCLLYELNGASIAVGRRSSPKTLVKRSL